MNDSIANQTSIEYFFKLIISQYMVEEIVANTNKRIKLIDVTQIGNAKYKSQRERLLKHDLTSNELYAFIGVLILLGITKKSKVPIEEIWSESSIHYSSFAAAALTRERFQLIIQNITFDDISEFSFSSL